MKIMHNSDWGEWVEVPFVVDEDGDICIAMEDFEKVN